MTRTKTSTSSRRSTRPECWKRPARSIGRARGARLGPAAGLPFAVKDQIEVAGYPATAGNGALRGYVPKRNAVVVERLVAAGAIPFCMTTLPDMTVDDGLMHQASSHSASFGAVRNPYDPSRIPGGSSGGSGAILAARIVPAALGADANGSIRCPSAFCGVTGLRPSTFTIENALRGTKRKRYSDEGLLPPPLGPLYTIGPMARTAADVAFLDTLITGESVPAVDLRAVRIAVPRPDYWERDVVDPAVAAVIQQAFARLRDAGCRLIEIDLHGEVRSIVGTFDNPTPAAVIAELGLSAPISSREVMAQWLREHAPDVSAEMMYRGRPMLDGPFPTLPPIDEQIKILAERRGDMRGLSSARCFGHRVPTTRPSQARSSGRTGGAVRRDDHAQRAPDGGGQSADAELVHCPANGCRRLECSGRTIPGLPVGLSSMRCRGTTASFWGWG